MPKVYVTQEVPRINYSAAMDYGDVVFLTTDEYKPEPTVGGFNDTVKASIMRNFSDYVPGVDYILTSGSPISIFLAGALVGNCSGRLATHKLLKWNNQSHRYDLCIV